jgi:FkbM family methyltransferase
VKTQGEGELDRIVHNRFFPGAAEGVFVDVGAARPDFFSMSALYRSLGWRVIAVEPNPVFCEAHRAAGHEVLEYACSDHDEDAADFEVVDSCGRTHEFGATSDAISFESFSSLAVKPSYRALLPDLHVRRIKVDVRRLDTILARHAPDVRRLDIVCVDVEGWELEVLDGLSFDHYRPAVLIVENLFDAAAYRRALRRRGYALWRRRAPNDVYVSSSLLSRGERAAARLRERYVLLERVFPRARARLRLRSRASALAPIFKR